MSLDLIIGPAGSGKTTCLYRRIIADSMRDPDTQHILIVPEQNTLQAAGELILLHPRHGILNIDVLSFNRLAYRVFEKTGELQENILTETGKNLLLRSAARRCPDEMTVFAGKLDRQGYISEIKSLLSEFAQYEVDDGQIEDMISAAGETGLLRLKLKDILVLKRAFDEERRGRYLMAEEVPGLFARAASEASFLHGARIYLDSFTGFTPVQMTAMRALFSLAEKITVTVTADPGTPLFGKVDEHELFALSRKTVQSLFKLADECRVLVSDPQWMDRKDGRFRNNEHLLWLEKNLLRPGKRVYPGEPPGDGSFPVSLHSCPSPASEAAFAARTVQKLVEEGYRYREIAVICSDLAAYGPYMDREMSIAGLPFFIDRKADAAVDPCLEFVRAAMDISEKGFSVDSVMRFLRTGLTGIPDERADRLENYLLLAGIRSRKRWMEEWTGTDREPAEEELAQLNRDRQFLLKRLEGFLAAFAGGKHAVADYTAALKKLLRDFNVEQQMKNKAEAFKDTAGTKMLLSVNDRNARAMECSQIYASLLRVLDEEEKILGHQHMIRREFAQILEAGLDELKIGLLPPGTDQVYIGDMTRTRLGNIRALIFTGANDGLVPLRSEKKGILSESDRDFLREQGVMLSPGLREDTYTQRFYLYLCLCRPSRRLYLSFARSSGDKAVLRPSYLISTLRQMFPFLVLHDEEAASADWRQAASYSRMMEILAGRICASSRRGDEDPGLRDLLRLAMKEERGHTVSTGVEDLVRASLVRMDTQALDPETAGLLYASVPALSVSRADTFASCPFAYFAQYGLFLAERKELRVNASDTGTLFHRALEKYACKVRDSKEYGWFDMPDSLCGELTDESFDEALAEQAVLYHDNPRNEYAAGRVREILHTAVWGIMRQIRAGAFEPSLFESEFRDGTLKGKIDRIDLAFEDNTLWVKVVDYKSGSTRFDLSLIYDGRQMQLPAYLKAAMEMLREKYPDYETMPAGVYYSHLKEPVLTETDMRGDPFAVSGETVGKKVLMELRPDGLTNADERSLRLFSEDPEVRELVVPVPRFNADGSVRKGTAAAYSREMDRLCAFTDRKIEEFAGRIMDGEIVPRPYVISGRYTCEYCLYRTVCGYEKRMPGAGARRKCTLSAQEILDRLED